MEIAIFAPAFRKERKTYCSIVSLSPPREKEQTCNIGAAPEGADFPYLHVACGEPRDVWRMSAPLVMPINRY